MTAAEKQKTAAFLDLAGDYLSTGYRGQPKEYNFTDDKIEDTPVNSASASAEKSPLDKIADEVRACRNCALGGLRKNAVPGEGIIQPLVMVIGEGPGADEDASGRPFVGRAGQLLDKMLASINLSRNTNCFIANVVKCRPPGNREPYPEEAAACARFLERQITILNPKFILAAGRVATQNLLKTTEPLSAYRGKFTTLTVANAPYKLFVTYHPSALLRNENLKRPAWEDLKLFRAEINKLSGEN